MMLLAQDHILGYWDLDYSNSLIPGLPAFPLACINLDDKTKVRNLKYKSDHIYFVPLFSALSIRTFFSMVS